MKLFNYVKVSLSIACICLVSMAQVRQALPQISQAQGVLQKSIGPNYAPGQIIIKFKDSSPLLAVADAVIAQGQKLSTISGNRNLDDVFKKRKINRLEKIHAPLSFKSSIGSRLITNRVADSLYTDLRNKKTFRARSKTFTKDAVHLASLYVAYFSDTGSSVEKVIAEIVKDDQVQYAIPNYRATLDMIPNDSLYGEQWSHQVTQAEAAWNIQTGSPNITVAVLDVGVAYTHPDLSANIWHDSFGNPGRDFVDIDTIAYKNGGNILYAGEDYTGSDNDPMDFYGHGTHCAGIIGAVGDNAGGIAGICHTCRIMPVRIGFQVSGSASIELDDCVAGIRYAADNGADVISMSFGFRNMNDSALNELKYAIDFAHDQGVLLVASAGNNHADVIQYPAYFDNVVAVSATGRHDEKADYSNLGYWVDIAAPGGTSESPILSTVPLTGGVLSDPSGYKGISGTSMACPYVAGFAALLKAQFPQDSEDRLRGRILASAENPGGLMFETSKMGAGRINAYNGLVISERPYCLVRNVKFTDASGNEQFILQPNTTVRMTIEVENVWSDAGNVTATLWVESSDVSLSTSVINFQSMNADEKKDNALSPVNIYIGNIDDNVIEKTYAVNVTLAADGYNTQRKVYLVVSQKSYMVKGFDRVGAGHDVSGKNIVFSEYTLGEDIVRIKCYNTISNTTEIISKYGDYGGTDWAIMPKISRHTVVWNDTRGGKFFSDDIYQYDLLTKTESVVDTGQGWQMYPEICGNTVVWANLADIMDPNLNADIYRFDRLSRQKSVVCNSPFLQIYAQVYGTNIVWQDYRSGLSNPSDIYGFDGSGEIAVANRPNDETFPQLFGNRVVWVDNRNGNPDVYLYDISTGAETPICTEPSEQKNPVIFGDRIVWSDHRNGVSNLYMYDIETQKETRLTYAPWDQVAPRISADKLIWMDYGSGIAKLRYADIENKYLGDVTGDKTADFKDALYVLQFVNNVRSFDDLQWENADVSVDGYVSIHDFRIAAEYVVGNLPKIKNPLVVGDVNGDRKIDWNDYMLIEAVVSGRGTFNTLQKIAGDVNGDKVIDASDLRLVDDYRKGAITEFPFAKK